MRFYVYQQSGEWCRLGDTTQQSVVHRLHHSLFDQTRCAIFISVPLLGRLMGT